MNAMKNRIGSSPEGNTRLTTTSRLARHIIRKPSNRLSRALRRSKQPDFPWKSKSSSLLLPNSSFRAILDALGDGVLITDLDDKVLYCNTRLAEMTGYTVDEMIGRPAYQLLVPETEWPRVHERNRQRARNVSECYEIPVLRKNGETWWAEINAAPLYAEDGHTVIGTVSCSADITLRKRAEEEKEKLLAELSYVAGSAHCFLWHAEISEAEPARGMRWRMATPALDNAPILFPIAVQEGEDFYRAWYRSRLPEDRIASDIIADTRIRNGQNFHREFRYYTADGQIRWASEDVAITVIEPGKIWHAVGVCTDVTERKHAEQERETSQQLMRQVIDQANCLLWRAEVREQFPEPGWTGVLYDEEHKTRTAWDLHIINDAADTVPSWLPVAREQGETITDAWLRSRHPDDTPLMDTRANDALRTEQPGYTQVFRNHMADGTLRWIYENVHIESLPPVFLPGNERPFRQWLLTGAATDITERRQADLEREASQQQLRQVTEQANCLLWRAEVREEFPNPGWYPRVFDPETGTTLIWDVQLVNENEMLRWLPIEQREGESIRDAWYFSRHPEDRERGDATSWNCLASDADRYTQTLRVLTQDGVRWVQEDVRVEALEPTLCLRAGDSTEREGSYLRRWQLTGVMTDITERKRVEDELRTSQAQLVAALDASGMGTWVWDIKQDYIWWDDSILKLLGGERLIGGKLEENAQNYTLVSAMKFIHPEDQENVLARLEAVLHKGTNLSMEFRIVRPDGSVRWIGSHGRLERDALGRPARMTGIITDITAYKQADEAQIRSQKLEALGTLAGGIAHDFNNILCAILGNAQLVASELSPDHPMQMAIGEIVRAGSRSTSLIRQILSFSRPQEQNRKTVSLVPIVQEALNLLRSTLPTTIEIRTAFASEIPNVTADTTQIHQVLVNLATNSAHAIGAMNGQRLQGGHIEVCIEAVEITEDLMGGHAVTGANLPVGRYVRLSVTDNGCGMESEMLTRIFDPFFTTKSVGEGTGLGLSVVHGIMKSHGGTVTVYSQPGIGSTFRLYFPTVAATVENTPPTPDPVSEIHKRYVLYVDDEEALTSLAQRVLQRAGCEVTICNNAKEAWKVFQTRPGDFDLVITDLSMPGMSGFDLARHILEIRPATTVVMTSGYIRPEDEEEARQLGIRAVLLKPFNLKDLIQMLERPNVPIHKVK